MSLHAIIYQIGKTLSFSTSQEFCEDPAVNANESTRGKASSTMQMSAATSQANYSLCHCPPIRKFFLICFISSGEIVGSQQGIRKEHDLGGDTETGKQETLGDICLCL